MGFSYNVNVLNQKGSPAIYTDTFANRPAFGFAGRLFISNDTAAIYEDTGTAWVLIANVSSGAGTLQQVTTNGNTSNVGISVTAGGVSTNSATITSLTQGSVPFVGAAGLITQDNTNLFFDDTNNRLGINTNTPSNNLDVHSTGTTPIIAINNTAGNQSLIAFAKNSTAKWRIGNSLTDTFDVLNVGLGSNAITISSASNSVSFLASIKIQQAAGFTGVAGFNGIGCDAGGFFFQIGTNTSNPYFNFIGLTGARTYTYPNATGTIALTSDLSAYLPLSGGTLTGALNTSAGVVINANSGALSISPSATRGVINLGGTTDNFLTFSNKGYIGVGATLMQILAQVGVSLSFVSDGATVMSFGLSTGNCLIGSSVDDTVNKLQVTGNAKITGLAGTGSRAVLADANGVLSAPVSDISVKENIEQLKYGLDTIMKLNAVQFEFKKEYKNYGEGLQIGAIAQQVEKIIPQAVFETPLTGLKGIDYNQFHGIYIKAIQDQQNIIDSLIKRIELLENK